MQAVVGLGNPGERYAMTRHNVSFMVVDRLCERFGLKLGHERARLRYALLPRGGQTILLAEPQTFMNCSGEPLLELGIRPENLLVIYDDLDLSPGQIRIRQRGSGGGHRGLGSIIDNLETQDFARIRLGIGRNADMSVVDYVLSEFGVEERELLTKQVDCAAEAVLACLDEGVPKAMNRFNRNVE